jgi:hypothetical protein
MPVPFGPNFPIAVFDLEERRANDWLKDPENRQLLLDAIRFDRVDSAIGPVNVVAIDDAAMAIALTFFAAWWAGLVEPPAPEVTTAYELEGGR